MPLRVIILNSARKFIGEAAHCLSLATQLRNRGHEVLLGVRHGCELETRASEAGLPLFPLTFSGSFSPISDFRDCRHLTATLRQWKPDLVHCHRGKDHWLAAAASLAVSRHVPIVRTRHVVVPMKGHVFNRWLIRNRTDGLMAVSQKAADSMEALTSIKGISVIHSAVDTERFHPKKRSAEFRTSAGIANDELLIGLIGRIQNIKGQHIFLEAAANVARQFPGTRFLIAGAGSPHKFQRMEANAAELGIRDRVVFCEWLDNIDEAIASLDIGVVASLGSEGSSRITYEYMASGVPVVATRVGGIPEIVEDLTTGILVPPGDAAALSTALLDLCASTEKRREMAAAALEYVHNHHTFDRWIADIVQIYETAIARKSA